MSWRGPTAAIVGAIALWGCVLWLGLGAGASRASDERVALVMTKLPPPGSPQYQAIRKRAGEVVVQPLRLTKAEAWSVPKASAEAATKAAAAQGVEVTTLAASWNHIFAPAPAGTAMTAEQRAMVQRAMASPSATAIATFLPPRAAVVEYALTREAGAPASIRVSLGKDTTVTISRTHVTVMADMLSWKGRVDGTGAPATLMWWPGAQMVGAIHHEGRIYSIRCMHGVLHGIVEMREDKMPPPHAPMPADLRAADPNLRRVQQ